ncbi:LRR receptor-like serine/threonine-protein kinase EFR isoform X1 [Pistacia vera]|uniref:LRR receptor-like serine/threonine-protein kinase EFR isoform X1 n=1 Tax=Pistacia vera TaxID=55513 RepID=UPI0012635A2A|nr:LRR receptor-like serine/threonine-protein kinase EFR isoform X1 [Pistacia vera]
MKKYCFNSKWFLLHFLRLCHLLWIITSASSGFESDELALLDFKKQITQDPLQIMRSWNASMHFCNWTGVTCSPTNGRVTILNLESQNLVGSLPPSIGNLTSLTAFNLGNNSFHGEVPPEIGRLQHLQYLNITDNYFGGSIPMNLSLCTKLRVIDAADNQFIGQIPDQIDSLLKLVTLLLPVNNLTGRIPASIGNLSSLAILSLSRNNLQGGIPKEVGQLSGIRFFQLSQNNLSGRQAGAPLEDSDPSSDQGFSFKKVYKSVVKRPVGFCKYS